MSQGQDRDGRAGGKPQAAGQTAGGGTLASRLDETSDLGVTASADGDDIDVLYTVLSTLEQGQADVDTVLAQLGAEFFSEKKGWRALFVRLLSDPRGSATFKRRALADYLDWLGRARGVNVPARTASHPQAGESDFGDRLVRLERGVPTTLRLDGVERIECRLGQCVVWISPGSPPRLAITGQPSVALEVGKTRVGRASANEVVLGARWDAVSRKHLEIEITHSLDIVLTDVSLHGTLVTRAAV